MATYVRRVAEPYLYPLDWNKYDTTDRIKLGLPPENSLFWFTETAMCERWLQSEDSKDTILFCQPGLSMERPQISCLVQDLLPRLEDRGLFEVHSSSRLAYINCADIISTWSKAFGQDPNPTRMDVSNADNSLGNFVILQALTSQIYSLAAGGEDEELIRLLNEMGQRPLEILSALAERSILKDEATNNMPPLSKLYGVRELVTVFLEAAKAVQGLQVIFIIIDNLGFIEHEMTHEFFPNLWRSIADLKSVPRIRLLVVSHRKEAFFSGLDKCLVLTKETERLGQ